MSGQPMLQIVGISLDFGGVRALDDVSIDVAEGELFAVIGPNGAGKSSLLNCISGFYRPQNGAIRYQGQDITKLPPHRIAKLGIARTFQHIALYTGLTTIENILAARHVFFRSTPLEAALFFGRPRREEVRHRRSCEEIIDFLELQPIRDEVVGMLPYGLRKRVDLGRALALEPKVLILDEPMAGMNLEEKKDMVRFILALMNLRQFTTIFVEHDMEVVMQIAEKIAVLDFGVVIARGSPDEIKNNPKVVSAYLGEERLAQGQ